jgi:hypothetical protein
MFLYFGGCSYTEGSGLADHEIFPDIYPGNYGNYKSGESITPKWRDTRFSLVRTNKELSDKLLASNNNRAYPAHIAKLLNAKVMNSGIGGNSIFGILVKTVHDLTELAKTNNIPDHVFIGLTSIQRIALVNLFPFEDDSRRWTQTLVPSHIHTAGNFEKYATEYWRTHTDDQMLTSYLYYCFSIKNYVKNITGKDPIFLNTGFHQFDKIMNNTNLSVLKEVWNLLEFNKLLQQKNLGEFGTNDENRYVADGHLSEEAHVKFASHIVEKFLTNN